MANGGKRPGAGRKKGSVGKIGADVKAMVLQALEGVGGASYLQEQATSNPNAFLTLVGKVMPLQLNHADNEGGKLSVTNILGAIDGASAGLPKTESEA